MFGNVRMSNQPLALLRPRDVVEPRIVQLARKVVDVPFAPALEHKHLGARLRQPARRHRAAKPGSDDDDVGVGHRDSKKHWFART